MKTRCGWATDSLYQEYHDKEWGVPVHDDNGLFEWLTLEGAQAGLSWRQILDRRENYRKAFAGFNPIKVAKFSDEHIERLVQDASIIRSRLKIRSTVNNAKRFLAIQKEFGSFDIYMWLFVNGKTIENSWQTLHDVPVDSPQSIKFSEDLKKRGFSFVGPKIIYSFMQATGMVNDHIVSCFRYGEVKQFAR